MPRRSALLACLLLLLVPARGIGQVQVAVRLEQPQYLAGEPVWVTVAVKNVGDEAVGYSGCDADVKLAVPGGTLKAKPKIMGCFGGMGGFVGCAIDHPPLLLPGRTTTFRYLLRGYKLGPGEYDLRVAGTRDGLARRRTFVDDELTQLGKRRPRVIAWIYGMTVEHYDARHAQVVPRPKRTE